MSVASCPVLVQFGSTQNVGSGLVCSVRFPSLVSLKLLASWTDDMLCRSGRMRWSNEAVWRCSWVSRRKHSPTSTPQWCRTPKTPTFITTVVRCVTRWCYTRNCISNMLHNAATLLKYVMIFIVYIVITVSLCLYNKTSLLDNNVLQTVLACCS